VFLVRKFGIFGIGHGSQRTWLVCDTVSYGLILESLESTTAASVLGLFVAPFFYGLIWLGCFLLARQLVCWHRFLWLDLVGLLSSGQTTRLLAPFFMA
jgi:hypothetical protein